MQTKEELKKYKAAWYQQNKLKSPEEKKVFDMENRKYRYKSGLYKISWSNCKYYYYGQSVKLAQRFIAHLSELNKRIHGNIKLQSVFNKYGKPNFNVIKCCPVSELDAAELELIKNACGDRFNCNIRIESTTNKGIKWSDETLKKCLQKRIIKGTSKLIYVYDSKTGELLSERHGIAEVSRSIGDKNCTATICAILSGISKTYKGFYFSTIKKNNQEVLDSVIPDNQKKEYKLKRSQAMCGSKNPMYGVKRPDCSGDNHHMRKKIAVGDMSHRKPKKLKIKVEEIIQLHNEALSAKEISVIAGCGSCNINFILRQNGIRKGIGYCRKNNKIKS